MEEGRGSPSVRWRDYKAVREEGRGSPSGWRDYKAVRRGGGVTKCKVEGLQGCGYGRRGGGHQVSCGCGRRGGGHQV